MSYRGDGGPAVGLPCLPVTAATTGSVSVPWRLGDSDDHRRRVLRLIRLCTCHNGNDRGTDLTRTHARAI